MKDVGHEDSPLLRLCPRCFDLIIVGTLTVLAALSTFLGLSSHARASGLVAEQLSLPLGSDQGIDDVIVSPDGRTVVYTIVDIERPTPMSTRLTDRHIFSVPLSGGITSQVDPLSLGLSHAGIGTFNSILVTSDSRFVIFSGKEAASGDSGLYRARIDGTDATQLAPFVSISGGARWLSLTSDDQWIAFRETNSGDVFSVPVGGGLVTQLNPPRGTDESTSGLYYSPPADRFLFLGRDNEYGTTLYSVRPDGTDLLTLNRSQSDEFNIPVRSVKTSEYSDFVFFNDDASVFPRNGHIYSVPADGGVPQKLSVLPDITLNLNPRPTPDGRFVVFDGHAESGGRFDFYAAPVAGGTPVRVNAPRSPGQELNLFPRFTSDGESMFYSIYNARAKLFRASLDGSGAQELIFPGSGSIGFVKSFVLSPDESTLAYVDRNLGIEDLYLVDSDGSVPVRVNPPLPDFTEIVAIRFSPDGRWLLYSADTEVDNIYQPFLTRIDLTDDQISAHGFRPMAVEVDDARSIIASFPNDQVALFRAGHVTDGGDLYTIRLPEPDAAAMMTVACWIGILFRRRRRR